MQDTRYSVLDPRYFEEKVHYRESSIENRAN